LQRDCEEVPETWWALHRSNMQSHTDRHTCSRLDAEEIIWRAIDELVGKSALEHLLKGVVIAIHIHTHYGHVPEAQRHLGHTLPQLIESTDAP
jgi:hypothetical protein